MFVCDHCGRCCTDKVSQIALTVGDLVRISEHLNISISSLFEEYVSFNPFRGEDSSVYDYEIGLNIPCKFRQKDKCIIYKSRDLNSRLFPFWLINAPDEFIDDDFGCLKQLKELKHKEVYIEYKEKIAKILLNESDFTDKIINQIGARKQIDLKDNEEYNSLVDEFKDNLHELEEKKVELAIRLRDDQFFNKFPLLIEK
jgi:Fe-S-cluster containining protein